MARRLNLLDDTQLLLRLDESGGGTAIDLSKNGLNGTATGTSAVAVSDMPFSTARRFVGTSSDRVVIAADAALNVASITIMGWIKPTTTGALQYIAQRYNAQGYGVLQDPSDELFFIMRDSGNVYRDVSSSISAKIGQWLHFAATFDQTIMRLYIDGVEVNNFTPTSGGIYYSGNLPFYVGCNQGATDNFLTADTADIAVVGRALAPWEIFNIYKAVRDPQVGFEVDADTICAYNFNNVAEGTLVHDDKLNDNTALDLHYKLNDDAATTVIVDDTGTLNGVLYGGKTTADMSEAGKLGTALRFDGAADYIDVVSAVDPTAYTIACWVKLDDTTNRSILYRADSNPPGVSYSHALRVASGVFSHYLFDGSIKTVNGTTTVVAGTWYHVAIVAQNSGYMRLYVNGVEEGTAVAIGSMWTGGDRWIIGYSYTGLGWLDGVLDDLRFYWGALSTGEIYKLWNGGAGIDTSYQYEAHMGSVVGSVPLINGPISTQGRSVSGSAGNRIDVANHADFNTLSAGFTVEAWATLANLTGPSRLASKQFGTSLPIPFLIDNVGSGAMRFFVRDSSNNSVSALTAAPYLLVADSLYYVACVLDATTKTAFLFLNGTLAAYAANPSVDLANCGNTQPATIGGYYSDTDTQYWNGLIHAVRFSNTAHTPKQIYDHYNGSNVQGVE